jgi:acyl carrier protein
MSNTITPEAVEQLVVAALTELGADADAVKRDATFKELDVDSLDLAELSQIVQEKIGVVLKSTDVASIKTVGDAIDLISERAAQA